MKIRLIISLIINIAFIAYWIHYNHSNLIKVPGFYISKVQSVGSDYDERGLSISRYYIEKFLEEHKEYIKGHTLEMQSPLYIKKFKKNITGYEILDLNPECKTATFYGDLQDTAKMPANKFDTFIMTQTLQYPYDTKSTLKSVYKMMKKNGALLITVPFVQWQDDQLLYSDSWRFTKYSLRKCLEDAGFEVQDLAAYGSEFSSTLYLQGMAVEDVKDIHNLDYTNEKAPMLIAALAIKP